MLHSLKYLIILDTTSDINHTEQLTIVIRFVYHNKSRNVAEIREQFLGFQSVTDTTSVGLFEFIINHLKLMNINISDLRGQSYDNGANMRGRHNGLQQKILEINSRASFVPCAAHSLNLVVNDAAKISFETVNFFSVIQELYNYFSISVTGWNVLKKYVKNLTLKPLSATRWEALKPLKMYMSEIYQALFDITNDHTKDMDSRAQANNIISKICSFKFLCSVSIWYDILNLVNIVSKIMQKPTFDLQLVTENLNSVLNNLKSLRTDEKFEELMTSAMAKARELDIEPDFPETRKRKKRKLFDYEASDDTVNDAKHDFKINFYFAILDTTISSISERFQQLQQHNEDNTQHQRSKTMG